MRTIEQIEIQLRTQIAHHIGMAYGPSGHMVAGNFEDTMNKDHQPIHSLIMENLSREIDRQKNSPFVKHHIDKYNRLFPVWVAVELMSFGSLSSLFSILKTEDQKAIAALYNTTPPFLKSWILCLVEVRNICAHYTRLYNMPLKQTPRFYNENNKYKGTQNKLFPILLIIKRMLNANEQWGSLFRDLEKTFNKYKGCFNLSFMGFPEDWIVILR